MPVWTLLLVPTSLLMIVLLLACVSWIEQRVLSPRALIVHTARSRRVEPDQVEAFVAAQSQTLLEGLALTPSNREPAAVDVAAD
jgi:hypothetical protein